LFASNTPQTQLIEDFSEEIQSEIKCILSDKMNELKRKLSEN
jgi:hypothetical protein